MLDKLLMEEAGGESSENIFAKDIRNRQPQKRQ